MNTDTVTFIRKCKQPINFKNPLEDFKIKYATSDGKTFYDEKEAINHEDILYSIRNYNRLSWLEKIFTKKPKLPQQEIK